MRAQHECEERVEGAVLIRSVHVGSYAHERLDLVGGSSGTRIVQRSDSVCIRLQSPITESHDTRRSTIHASTVHSAHAGI